MRLTAKQIAEATGGKLRGPSGAVADSYAIDTRRLDAGGCFFALVGDRDGNDFVEDAWTRGATVAVVSRPPKRVPAGHAVVRVPDSLVALEALGRHARHRLPASTVVGITGSAGKTATKNLLAGALGATHRVHASPASFNNEAGVPLTLLAADEDTEVVVTEMGARFAGNIAELCAIAEPQVGVITHIGMAHAGLLGGREGIARVKGELLESLDRDGTAILDDELRPRFQLVTPWGRTRVCLAVRGERQAVNAAMAAAAALELGAPLEQVAEGLSHAVTAAWRMDVTRTVRHLAEGKRRIAVLGEMLELGDHARAEHQKIGRLAVASQVDVVIAVGNGARPIADGARWAGNGGAQVIEVDDADRAVMAVAALAGPGDAVLVKASRAVGLERVAEALTESVGA